jgi:3-oxoadipate enol-lactonase
MRERRQRSATAGNQMTHVTLPSNAEVWYTRNGSGPVLLHIHGSGFGHKNFEALSPLLYDRFEVVDFDLPGFGASSRGDNAGGVQSLTDEIADFVAAIGLERVHVHGTSFGGVLGLVLAATHPESVDRLVLSCFLAKYDRAARAMRATWKQAAVGVGMELVAELTAVAGFSRHYFDGQEAVVCLEQMRDAFRGSDPTSFIAATTALEESDFSALAGDVRAPVLLLGGEEDNITPPTPTASGVGIVQLHEMIATSELAVVQNAGHYLVIEQPEKVAAAVTRFLLAEATV